MPNIHIHLQAHTAAFPAVPLGILFQPLSLSHTLLIATVHSLFWISVMFQDVLPKYSSQVLLELYPYQLLHTNLGSKAKFLPSNIKCFLYERTVTLHPVLITVIPASPSPKQISFGSVKRFPSAHQQLKLSHLQ